jgi:hypothetical protein
VLSLLPGRCSIACGRGSERCGAEGMIKPAAEPDGGAAAAHTLTKER